MNNQPSHRICIVPEADDQSEQKPSRIRVGSTWPHKDGKGLNLVVTPGISLGGRIVLREVDEEAEARRAKPPKQVRDDQRTTMVARPRFAAPTLSSEHAPTVGMFVYCQDPETVGYDYSASVLKEIFVPKLRIDSARGPTPTTSSQIMWDTTPREERWTMHTACTQGVRRHTVHAASLSRSVGVPDRAAGPLQKCVASCA
jgi:hypothetical protein